MDKILYISDCPSVRLSLSRSVGLLIEIQSIEATGLKLGGVDRLWSEGVQNEIWEKKVLIKGVKCPFKGVKLLI